MSLFTPGIAPALDDNGNPISGGMWKFYRSGTSTPAAVYADSDLGSSLGATVTANGAGRFVPIYLNDAVLYKAVKTNAAGTPLSNGTIDPVNGALGASVEIFGAVGDGATDDTTAIQAAFNALAAGTIGGLYFPDGTYRITAAIALSAANFTGKHIYGQSRFGTIIRQDTDNTPIFSFTNVSLHHTLDWSTLSFWWLTDQTGNTDSWVFDWTGDNVSSEDVYNSTFEKIFVNNCYGFMRGTDINFWGCAVRDVWANTKGGFVSFFDGNGGQPKVMWENIYINGGAAGEVLFNLGAMVAEYWVEVTGTSAMLLKDYGGGQHFIRHWALENATYASGTLFLFDMLNSKLTCSTHIYTNNITLSGTTTLYAFRTSGADGYIGVKSYEFAGTTQASGTTFTVFGGAGDRPCEFGRFIGTFSAPNTTPVMQLTNVPGSAACDSVTVREWLDPSRLTLAGDANVTVDYDDPMTIIFGTALTADRKVILPREGAVSGNNYFRGRTFKVVKLANAGTTYKIDIVKYDGTTVVDTILAATVSGSKTVRWDRSSPIGTGGLGFLTVEPVPV